MAMDYQGDIFRLASEVHTILFLVTTGCSHNRCTFCDIYTRSPFTLELIQLALKGEVYLRHDDFPQGLRGRKGRSGG